MSGENGKGVGWNISPLFYRSSTALGQQIAALAAVYTTLNAAQAPSSASATDSTAYNLLKTATLGPLMASMEALVALDEQLIAYDAQVAAYSKKCDALATSVAAASAVSQPAAIGIGIGGTVFGGILGFTAAKTIGKDLFK